MIWSTMKKALILVAITFVVFVISHRHRLYLRDPIAKVTRDGLAADGVQVYINYSNDVLLLNEAGPRTMVVVQHEHHAGTPVEMYCLRWTACLSEWDTVTLAKGMKGPIGAMSAKRVEYRDDEGRNVLVTLR